MATETKNGCDLNQNRGEFIYKVMELRMCLNNSAKVRYKRRFCCLLWALLLIPPQLYFVTGSHNFD